MEKGGVQLGCDGWPSGMPEPQPGHQLILVLQRGKGALLESFPPAVGSCQHPDLLP